MKQVKSLTRKEIKEKILELILSENPEDWRLSHTLQYFLNVTILDPSDTPHFVIEKNEEEIEEDNCIRPVIVPEAITPEGMISFHGEIVSKIN